jgi:hypothetical protein
MGSIDDNGSGGSYAYRTSKAALNIVNKSMSVDLAHRRITSVLLHPGRHAWMGDAVLVCRGALVYRTYFTHDVVALVYRTYFTHDVSGADPYPYVHPRRRLCTDWHDQRQRVDQREGELCLWWPRPPPTTLLCFAVDQGVLGRIPM